MKQVMAILFILVSLFGGAQENTTFKLQFDQSKISPQFTQPELPATVMPTTNLKINTLPNYSPTTIDKVSYRMDNLADSLAIYQQDLSNSRFNTMPSFRYDTSPYSRDWASSGVITRIGSGYLTGSGSHTTYPGMGNTASANVAFTMPMGERFQVTAGVTGSKYHFDNSAWNDFGVFGNATYWLNDRFSLNAFGQYYVNQRYHSIGAMPFLGGSSYGGTIGWKATNFLSLDVGARRIYDPYTGTWRTLPVVQPTINLFGAPISFDAGPLIYQVLNNIFNNGKGRRSWDDPKYLPVSAPDVFRSQPGFNPNSPVSIPDAFRH